MPVLQFKGKTAVENYHHTVPHHRLEFDAELSLLGKGEKPSLDGNLLIEGDNLLALKALLPTHAGKVKCIYIDPPYNTGNEGWVYNDNLTQPQFKEWIGRTVGKEGEDACRHDKWCCMMYPRLIMLKELLRDDGVILASIDDNEVHHMRCLFDEIFGESNLIGSFVWEGAIKNDARFMSVSHDYILCYAKRFESLTANVQKWRTRKEGIDDIYSTADKLKKKHRKDYSAASLGLREWFASLPKAHPAWQHRHYSEIDEKGVFFPGDISWHGGGGPTYEVLHPKTGKPVASSARGWTFPTPERMAGAIAEGRVFFGPDETSVPKLKRYLHETEGQVLPSIFYKDRRGAMQRLRELMGADEFENPKDEQVLAKIFEAVTEADSLILDSFAGSGTTAHAVLQLNRLDGGRRRFILSQLKYDSKEDEKARRNICEKVTAKRIRHAICAEREREREANSVPDMNFTYARVGDPLFTEYRDFGKKLPDWETLARYIFYTETAQECDSKKMNQKSGFIGSTDAAGGTSYYLRYSADNEENERVSLHTLPDLLKKDKNKNIVIYAERVWLHGDELAKFERENGRQIRPMVVPFGLK